MTIHLAVFGLGFGLVIATLTTGVMNSSQADQKGMASSIIITTRMIGMIIGLSAITSWGMGRFYLITEDTSLTDILNAPENVQQSFLGLFHNFFFAAMIICIVAVIPALFLRNKRD
jgi:uncharacterized membrane protein